ncbi:MAG TPA: acetyl-CoA C-acyltransferase, partial [Thermoanaerobaculia bacterium]
MQTHPRAAIVRGLRTPFAKAGTVYRDLDALDLGRIVVAELVQRSGIDPKTIDEVIYGVVIPSVKAANIAREIVLGTGIPRSVSSHTVTRACASSNQAITSGADLIFRGY